MKSQKYKIDLSLPIIIGIIIIIFSCKSNNKLINNELYKNTYIDSTVIPNENLVKVITPYKNQLQTLMNTQISFTKEDLNKGGLTSSLGNLVADLSYQYANDYNLKNNIQKPDFVLLNEGGLRNNISAGKITQQTIFELYPFDNQMVIVSLKGTDVKNMINYLIKTKKGHPLSNISILKAGNEYETKIAGKDFDSIKSYWVVTSDYLSNGGDNMNFFKNANQVIETNQKIRDIIISELSKIDTVQVKHDKRLE